MVSNVVRRGRGNEAIARSSLEDVTGDFQGSVGEFGCGLDSSWFLCFLGFNEGVDRVFYDGIVILLRDCWIEYGGRLSTSDALE